MKKYLPKTSADFHCIINFICSHFTYYFLFLTEKTVECKSGKSKHPC